jgi:hypothetical protein
LLVFHHFPVCPSALHNSGFRVTPESDSCCRHVLCALGSLHWCGPFQNGQGSGLGCVLGLRATFHSVARRKFQFCCDRVEVSIYGNFLRIPDPRVGLIQWVCSVCSRRSVLLRAWCTASSGAVQDNCQYWSGMGPCSIQDRTG